jgi:alpha-1,2-mannosyltransferase
MSFEIHPACGGTPTKLFRLAVVVWIVFGFGCAVKAVVSPVKHNSFHAFQAGASLWMADRNMYHGTFYEFRYGPAFAMLFSPLALLPPAIGSLLWMGLGLTAFAWSLRVLVRDILPCAWTPDREGAYLLLVLAASYRGFWSAQSNGLIFACVVAGMQAIAQRRWAWAALCLAFPVHIKIWPVAAALLVIACWPRQLTARFAAAIGAVAVLPLLVKGPTVVWDRYYDWYAAITGKMQIRHDYRDFWTLLDLVYPPLESGYVVLQLSTGILVLALCLAQQRRGVTSAQLFTFVLGLWTAWQLTFGPGSERNTFGIIAPLTAWAVVTAFTVERGRAVVITAYALTILAGVGQIERALLPNYPLVAVAHPVAVMIFAGWLVHYARSWQSTRDNRRTPNRGPWLAPWRPPMRPSLG